MQISNESVSGWEEVRIGVESEDMDEELRLELGGWVDLAKLGEKAPHQQQKNYTSRRNRIRGKKQEQMKQEQKEQHQQKLQQKE